MILGVPLTAPWHGQRCLLFILVVLFMLSANVDALNQSVSNYWVDGECGSDGGPGNSQDDPFRSFEPLFDILSHSSASSIFIWVSPGSYDIHSLSWSFMTSISISKCIENCPKCNTNSGSVQLVFSQLDDVLDQPALLQMPLPHGVTTIHAPNISLAHLEVVSGPKPWTTDVISIVSANLVLSNISFSSFIVKGIASLLNVSNRSDIQLLSCKWENNSYIGSFAHGVFVRTYSDSRPVPWYPNDIELSFVMNDCIVNDNSIDTDFELTGGLFFISFFSHVNIFDSTFNRTELHGNIGQALGLVMFINHTSARQEVMKINIMRSIFHRNQMRLQTSRGGALRMFVTRARVNIDKCTFSRNLAGTGSAIDFSVFSDPFFSAIWITNSLFDANFALKSVVSVSQVYRTTILNCVFRRNGSFFGGVISRNMDIQTSRLMMIGVLVTDAPFEPSIPGSTGSGILLAAKSATISNIMIKDLNPLFPIVLLELDTVPSLDSHPDAAMFSLDHVTIENVNIGQGLYSQRLVWITPAAGVGVLPSVELKNFFFKNLNFEGFVFIGPVSLISVQNLREVKLDQLYVHNVTTSALTSTQETHLFESNFFRAPTPIDTPIAIINFEELEQIDIKNVNISQSNGKLDINGVTGLISIFNVSMTQFQAPAAITISNYVEASMDSVLVQDLLGVAMRVTRGMKLSVVNYQVENCRHPLSDGAGLHVTSTTSVFIVHSFFNSLSANSGGAIFVWEVDGLKISFTDVEDNTALFGGAIMAQAKMVSLNNNTFSGNQAIGGNGGAIFAETQIFTSFGDLFSFNSASRDGGALAFLLSPQSVDASLSLELILYGTSFLSNEASFNGGAIAVPSRTSISTLPAGLELSVTMDQVVANANMASSKPIIMRKPTPFPLPSYAVPSVETDGGLGGFWVSPYPSTFIVTNGRFLHNSAQHGGVFFFGSPLPNINPSAPQEFLVNKSTFSHNYAYGGAVFHVDIRGRTQDRFTRNFVSHNTATFGGFLALVRGPTYWFVDSHIEMGDKSNRNRFVNNSATAGGVLFVTRPDQSMETKFVNQQFIANRAEVGAVACYSKINSFSRTSSPCYGLNRCENNIASGFGVERATIHNELLLDLPLRKKNSTLRAYSALTTVYGAVYDDYGQLFTDGIRYPLTLGLAVFDSISNPNISPTTNSTAFISYQSPHEGPLPSLQSTTEDQSFVDNGKAEINFLVLYPSTKPIDARLSMISSYSDPVDLNLKLGGCPIGMKFDSAFGCIRCPLGSFSLTNDLECIQCPLSPHLSCFNGEPLSSRGYWVAVAENRSAVASVACPFPDRCLGGFNQCSSGRTGFLCSSCEKGRSESWTSNCSVCDHVNWPLVSLAFVGLWIVTLGLHSLISRSSGKATILIYFIQTSYFLISDIPLSPFFNALTRSPQSLQSTSSSTPSNNPIDALGFFLCLAPMDIFQRQLLIASVPIIMAFQFLITFLIYHTILFIIHMRNKNITNTTGKQQGAISSNWLGFGSSDDDIVFLSDSEFKEGEEKSESSEGSLNHVTQVISMEIYENHENNVLMTHQSSEKMIKDFKINSEEDLAIEASEDQESGNEMRNEENSNSDGTTSTHDASIPLIGRSDEIIRMSEETRFFHSYRMIRTLVYLFAQSFSSFLGFIMIFTDCRSLISIPHETYMAKSPSESCSSEKYKRWRLSLILTVPWLVAVVAFVSYRLFYGRAKGLLSNQDVRFGVLYEMFRSKFFFWKIFELARRFVLAIPFLPNSTASERAHAYAVLMMIVFAAQIGARPYAQPLENQLAAFTLAALILIALLTSWNPHDNPKLTIAIPGVILAIVVLVVIATLVALLRTKLIHFKVLKSRLLGKS